MKLKEIPRILRSILGWLLIAAGGLWGVSTGICGLLALFGVLGTDSVEERLILFAASLVITIGSFTILWLVIRLKNSVRRDKIIPPAQRESAPKAARAVPEPDTPEIIRRRNMTFEEKLTPVFIPNLAEYQMKMHTDSGEEYCFTLTGLKAYHPNMVSRCGYGTDDWCFYCKYNGENYILNFCDDSGYGTYWDCALINKENAEQLEKLSATEWLELVYCSENRIFHLHPDTIGGVKKIVQDTSSRCGPISDNGFYGH